VRKDDLGIMETELSKNKTEVGDYCKLNRKSTSRVALERKLSGGTPIEERDEFMGVMEKLRPNFIKTWQKRFFLLEKRALKYYKQESDYINTRSPLGIINFDQIEVVTEFIDKELRINLSIKGCERVFQLRCPEHDKYTQWKNKLIFTIENSVGKKKRLSIKDYQEVNPT
jgi:hypothetical protein